MTLLTFDSLGVAALVAGSYVGTLLVGVVIGILYRDAFVILKTGKGFIVNDSRRFGRNVSVIAHRALKSRTLGIVLVVLAMLASAAVGVLLIHTREVARQTNEDLVELVECLQDYNREAGDARDERDARGQQSTILEVYLWGKIRDVLASSDPNGGQVAIDSIDVYLRSIEELQDTRIENPYPAPDRCARLGP